MTIKELLRNWLFGDEIRKIERMEKENQELQRQVNDVLILHSSTLTT